MLFFLKRLKKIIDINRSLLIALSFSKKLENHIGMIKYFICHYNQQRALLIWDYQIFFDYFNNFSKVLRF